MAEKLLSKQCIHCGAKLTLREGELLCEYCGSSYEIPNDYVKDDGDNHQKDQIILPSMNQFSPKTESNSTSYPQYQQKSNSKNSCFVWLIVLLVLGGLVAVFLPKMFLKNDQPNQPINSEKETESRMFHRLSYDLEYPADFFHGQPLSVGAIMDFATIDAFEVSIQVKNELSRNIEANLKADQLIIESVEVTDSSSTHYSCEFDNYFTGSEVIEPDEIESVGRISCEPVIHPEAKFITLNVTFTNWGNYVFQIPLDSIKQNLNFEYTLYRGDNEFQIVITFYSVPPQYITVYFNDISVVDDKGNYYNLDHCSDGGFDISTERAFYAHMADDSGMGNATIFCTFEKPILYDINAITLVMNIRGNTITHLFTTDTLN